MLRANPFRVALVHHRRVQVTLSIELDDSQVDEFQRMIPVQLALPPWNYTDALDKGITVDARHLRKYIR